MKKIATVAVLVIAIPAIVLSWAPVWAQTKTTGGETSDVPAAWEMRFEESCRDLMRAGPLVVERVFYGWDTDEPFVQIRLHKMATGRRYMVELKKCDRLTVGFWQIRPGDQIVVLNWRVTLIKNVKISGSHFRWEEMESYNFPDATWGW